MWLNMAENCLKELISFHIFLAIVQKSTRYDANQHIRCLPTLHIFLTAKQLQKSTTTQQDIENCRKKTVFAHSFWRESKKKTQCNTFLCQQDNARYGDQFSYSIKCVFCCCNGVPLFLTSFVRTKMLRKKAQNKIIPSLYSFKNIQTQCCCNGVVLSYPTCVFTLDTGRYPNAKQYAYSIKRGCYLTSMLFQTCLVSVQFRRWWHCSQWSVCSYTTEMQKQIDCNDAQQTSQGMKMMSIFSCIVVALIFFPS